MRRHEVGRRAGSIEVQLPVVVQLPADLVENEKPTERGHLPERIIRTARVPAEHGIAARLNEPRKREEESAFHVEEQLYGAMRLPHADRSHDQREPLLGRARVGRAATAGRDLLEEVLGDPRTTEFLLQERRLEVGPARFAVGRGEAVFW